MSTKRSIIFEDERNGTVTAPKRLVASLTAQPRYLVPANDGDEGSPAPAMLAPLAISAKRLARFFR